MRRLLFSICFLAVTSTLRGVLSIEEIKYDDDKSIEVTSEEKENVAESSNKEVPDNLIDDFNEIYKAIVSEIESIEEEYSQEENDEQTETENKINKDVANKGVEKPNEDKLKINVETLSENDNIEDGEEDNEVMEPANKVVPGDEVYKVPADAKASKKDSDDTANKIVGDGTVDEKVADDKAKNLDTEAKAAEAEKDVISNGEKVADAEDDATGDYVVMKAIDLYNILDLLNEYRRRSMMQAIWVFDMQGGRSEDNRQMNIPVSAFDERPRAEKLMDNLSLENVQSYFTQAKDYITKKIDWNVFHLLLIGICLGAIMSISVELCTSKPKERRVHVPFTQDYYTLEKKAYPAVLPTYEECIHRETKAKKMEREAAEEKAGCTLQ